MEQKGAGMVTDAIEVITAKLRLERLGHTLLYALLPGTKTLDQYQFLP